MIGRGTIVADKKTQDMAQFYNECQNKGYTDMQDETQSLKAKVIAMDLGLNYRKIAELYKEAERCAKIVHQEEEQKSIRAKKEAEEKEKLAAKQAVPGTLILELMSSKEGPSGKRVQVFHRPDGTIYSLIVPGSYRVEGAPSISIHSSSATLFTYTPNKTIFTSATVGGITTGGFDTIKGGYSASSSRSGKGYLALKLLSDDFMIMRCKIPADVRKVFRRDPLMSMSNSDGEIKVFQESSLANTYRTAMFAPGNDVYRTMSALSLAQDEERLPLSTCSRILDLVAKIINGPWPPTDQQLFDEACAQGESNESKIVEKALKTIKELEKQPDLPRETLSTKKKELQQRYDDMVQAEKEALVLRKEARAKKTKKVLAIVFPVLVVSIVAVLLYNLVIIPNKNYNNAKALMDAGQYEEAIIAFKEMDGYKDSEEQLNAAISARADQARANNYKKAIELLEAGDYGAAVTLFQNLGDYKDSREKAIEAQDAKLSSIYTQAQALAQEGKKLEAALVFYQIKDYKDARQRCFDLWEESTTREHLSAGWHHTIGLHADGTVVVVGSNDYGECDLSDWQDIVAVSAGGFHSVGLRSDGTVVAVGSNKYRQCNVSDWKDIVAVSSGGYHTLGLRADGTVVAVGNSDYGQCKVSNWRDIVAVSAGRFHSIGLRSDGTVVAVGRSNEGSCNVSSWQDIVAVSAGGHHTVGLRSDGTVVAVGSNEYGQCNVSDWKDIVAVSAGGSHTVGLRSDGTVVAVGYNESFQCNVSKWRNIVAVSAGAAHTLGLRSDGTAVATGDSSKGACEVSKWKDIVLPC